MTRTLFCAAMLTFGAGAAGAEVLQAAAGLDRGLSAGVFCGPPTEEVIATEDPDTPDYGGYADGWTYVLSGDRVPAGVGNIGMGLTIPEGTFDGDSVFTVDLVYGAEARQETWTTWPTAGGGLLIGYNAGPEPFVEGPWTFTLRQNGKAILSYRFTVAPAGKGVSPCG